MWKEKCKDLGLFFIFLSLRFVISLRYRLHVEGMENLKSENLPKKGGFLFLPNHPAEIDPVIVMMILWKKFRPRPLTVDYFFFAKAQRFFLNLVKAIPIPNMDLFVNKWKAKQVDKVFAEIKKELSNKENFLIYPAGRLKLTGLEVLGGASFVHNLVQSCPEANVALVRITGLWGSRFSRALTGSVPDFGKELLEGVKILLKNFIFFTPRRDVHIQISQAPKDFPFSGDRIEFNGYLQKWYNQYPNPGPEPLALVSYRFWKKTLPEVKPSKKSQESEAEISIPLEVQKEIFSHLATMSGRSPHQIERNMNLAMDLGFDSLDIAQLYVFLDEKYDITNLQPGDLQTVEDLLKAASGQKKTRGEVLREEKKETPAWFSEKGRPAPESPKGATLQECFLNSCERMGKTIAIADSFTGPLSYKRMKTASLVLSRHIAELPGEYIGVMMPAAVGTYLVILACLLANKIPVMLNWTAGVRSLDHSSDLTKLQVVITSKRFLNRLENGDLGKIEDMLVFMEEIKFSLSIKKKIQGLFLARKSPQSLLKRLGLDKKKEDDLAVILFTSGTESLPKAVPLSHKNLLSDIRSAFSLVKFYSDDILYGVLPPFHSFGFSVTGVMMPLLGLKIFYAPDPTDAHGMAHDIMHWKPTLFCCAPSFTKVLFRVAEPKMLQSIRLFITGAEKAPPDLFEYVKKLGPNKIVVEGYGITECGPIVTLDRPEKPPKGVGEPIPGVELCVIDESLQILPQGKEGEICIRGPNVFNGYLGKSPNPFIEIQGKRWYRSGDRGYLDSDGTLILSGRLKRFIKIGGEMVSLAGLEEELVKLSVQKKWVAGMEKGPALAISVKDKESDKPLIILYTTFDISKEEVNSVLRESGYGRIVKISEVKRLKEIPLTGTGKTHYRLLDEMES